MEGNRKRQCINVIDKIFQRAAFEAGEAFKEATQQINIKLTRDQRGLQPLARVIPIMTFCKMLKEPENLNALKDMLQSLRS